MADAVETLMHTAGGAAVAGFFSWLVARTKAKKSPGEVSNQIANGFTKLVDQLQEENSRHLKQIDSLREEGHRLRNQLSKLRAYAELLFRHIGKLEDLISAQGHTPPARPELPSPD